MKFDGTPAIYDAPFNSALSLSPPDETEDDVKIEDFLISSGFGIYIPQIFTERFEKQDCVSDWAWETCKKGPPEDKENYDYDEAWAEILDTYEYFCYEGNGCTFRYFLQHEEDLCLIRQFISQELDD